MPLSTTTDALSRFLQTPDIETSPAWELMGKEPQQKPMPTLFHSRLQRNLVNWINQNTTTHEAIQELRCIVPPYSPVPDIVVVPIEHLPDEDGPIQRAPDWLIEIRSTDQSTLPLQQKILHCLNNGSQLAWLIDLQKQQIWIWQNDQLPLIYGNTDPLPTVGVGSPVTVEGVMAMTQRSQ